MIRMQGDCQAAYVDQGQVLEPPLLEWQAGQCVVILPEPGPGSIETSLLFVASDNMRVQGVLLQHAEPMSCYWAKQLVVQALPSPTGILLDQQIFRFNTSEGH